MDELILRRAQKGDASAFEQLVTPYEQMIWRVCWHYLHHREDAMDCAQEVMLKAWRSAELRLFQLAVPHCGQRMH